TPVLLSTGEDHPWFLFSYTLMLNVGLLALVRTRGWRVLEVLGVGATFALFWGWYNTHFNEAKRLVATFFALIFYAVFVEVARWPLFVISQVSAVFAIAPIWPKSIGVFFFLELVIAAGGLIVAERRRSAVILSVTFGAFWAVYGLWYESLPQPRP